MAKDKIHVAEKGRYLDPETEERPGDIYADRQTAQLSAGAEGVGIGQPNSDVEEFAQGKAAAGSTAPAINIAPAQGVAPGSGQGNTEAMTYVDDGNGNIIAGPGVGIPAQAQQPVVTPTVTATQPAETVVQDAGEQPAVEQPADEITARPQRDYGSQPASRNAVTDAQMQKISDVESGKAQPQQFEFNWDSGISFADVVRSSDRPKRAILDDYMAWSRATGNPVNWYEVSQVIGDTNVDNNFHQDDVDEKKAARKAKWDALGTFLTHLGNAVGAAGWGGSVKLHDPVELSKRQREIFEKTQALRRQRNKDMMEAYMKQYESDRKARIDAANVDYKKTQGAVAQQNADTRAKKTDSDIAKNEATIRYYNARTGQIEMITPAQLDKIQAEAERARKSGNAAMQNAATNNYKAHASTTSTTTDANGNVKTTVTTRGGSNNGSKGKKKSAFGSRTSGKSAFGKR